MLERAIIIATEAHMGQVDKGGNHYILHPLTVMLKMETTEGKIVAVLHDVIEDTHLTAEDLKREGFSDEVIEGVVALTKVKDEKYMDFIERCSKNTLAKAVKIEDIKHNLDTSRLSEEQIKNNKDLLERSERYEKALKYLLK